MRLALSFVVAALSLALQACTTCYDTVITEATNPEFVARTVHRVCGVASGFSVQLYPAAGKPPGHGQGALEPFQTFCRCPQQPVSGFSPPVRLTWEANDHLLVEWDDCLPQYSSRQVPRRANPDYLGVHIDYSPTVIVPVP
jgi:hypothetical protein